VSGEPYFGLDLSDPLVAAAFVFAVGLLVGFAGLVAAFFAAFAGESGASLWTIAIGFVVGLGLGGYVVYDYNENRPARDAERAQAPSAPRPERREGECAEIRGVRIRLRAEADCDALEAAAEPVVPPAGTDLAEGFRSTSTNGPYACELRVSDGRLRGACSEGGTRVAVLSGPLP
jgi:hypothetical protein